jgi:hypothetical protein
LWITSRTVSGSVNTTPLIAPALKPCADKSTICARRQVPDAGPVATTTSTRHARTLHPTRQTLPVTPLARLRVRDGGPSRASPRTRKRLAVTEACANCVLHAYDGDADTSTYVLEPRIERPHCSWSFVTPV